MKTPIEVRLMGPTLLCQAVEALLATVGPIYWENTAVVANADDTEENMAVATMRRRSTPSSLSSVIILLIGEGWQNRVLAESRLARRNATNTNVTPRYALIADGNKIDFYGARKMAVNAFIGTDEPVSVLIQGIQAAAQNRLYCSPQLLPALIDAVGSGTTSTAFGDVPTNKATEAAPAGNSTANVREASENTTASQAALLSTREHEVALHAARGLSNEQIAVFLGISIPTVKFHLMHAFRKLSIQRRTQLYAFMPFLTSATEALLPPVVD